MSLSAAILAWSLFACRLLLCAAALLLTYRMIRGTEAQDRIIAIDGFYTIAMLLFAGCSIIPGGRLYFEAALMIALLGFVSTIALAKFLMRGEVIE